MRAVAVQAFGGPEGLAVIDAPDRRAAIASLLAAGGRGELCPVVHEQLPLGQAVLAHQKMDAGEVFGRIVRTPA